MKNTILATCALGVASLLAIPAACAVQDQSHPTTSSVSKDTRYANYRPKSDEYRYVAAWRGHHVDSKRFGMGTIELIAPSWGVTAGHVASPKAREPETRNVIVKFPRDVTRTVVEALKAPSGDFAIARFNKPITEIKPVKILERPLTLEDGMFAFTVVGQTKGLHAVPGHKGFGDGPNLWRPKKGANLPGATSGDSGGAWVLDQPGDGNDVLIGTIIGGGKHNGVPMGNAFQPAIHRKWIDEKLAATGEKATWVPVPKWVTFTPVPADIATTETKAASGAPATAPQ